MRRSHVLQLAQADRPEIDRLVAFYEQKIVELKSENVPHLDIFTVAIQRAMRFCAVLALIGTVVTLTVPDSNWTWTIPAVFCIIFLAADIEIGRDSRRTVRQIKEYQAALRILKKRQ